MARKEKEVASASTPSRSRKTKNSNRGRDEGFPAERFDSQIHHDWWKTMEHRGITHEWIIHFLDREPDFMRDRIEELGWWFMYNAFPPINVAMVREFCSNFSVAHQTHVFLRGRRIPFIQDNIRRFLDININLPPPGENDMFLTKVIGRLGTNWANNPVDNTIPNRKIDNAILNAQATAWHKLIIANIDLKQHGITFDINHAILIYVLMTEGVVNLPHIMRDVLLKRPVGNSCNLLPYLVFIARLAIRHQVPEFPRDEFYNVREQDMYCPYGDWKGEQPKVCRSRLIPLRKHLQFNNQSIEKSSNHHHHQQLLRSPPHQSSACPEPSLREIMRHLERQERLLRRQGRQLQNTQNMIRQAFPDTVFTSLMQVPSSEDGSDGTNVLEKSDAESYMH
ncbi:hypothetical protein PIB30_081580 [Stylosanthes scabra]|uniref:Putative plant transposon protein domain-containing protein n=1 Tax=Stylosanthes scabra TaxID=79078 RepID=A0ABU6XQ46_9FABA|nr:hypothetical protein [Stylosanthes scabra]